MEGKVHLGWEEGSLILCVGTSESLPFQSCQDVKLKVPLPLATKQERGLGSVVCW